MTGVLVVDKPAGPTSHDVVARVRRILGERRIGHTGTLDPIATGVLPLVVGKATRLASLLSVGEKEYLAGMRFGYATDTYDATGTPSGTAWPRGASSITRADIEAALAGFRGTFDQMPPAFSAKKVGGVASYELARRKQTAALTPAPVTVHVLRLEAFDDGLVTLRIVSSSGFYVRSLAHELGDRLGCGAHLETLRRTRAGGFSDADAAPLAQLEAEGSHAGARLITGQRLLPDLPAVVLNARGVRRASHGTRLSPADLEGGQPPFEGGQPPFRDPKGGCPPFRLFDSAGRLIAIAERRADGLLHPVVVLL